MYRLRYSFFFCIGLLTCGTLSAQISGMVRDQSGQTLPFAAVYWANSTNGTICNEKGEYVIESAKSDTATLVFQYIGYETVYKKINSRRQQTINATLHPQHFILDELVISTKREDPAYEIIRKTIAEKAKNKTKHQTYTADIYAKSLIRMDKMPEKFLGENLGTLGGLVDTSGQGILYFSESTSKFYFQYPDKTKEIMISSTSSGTDVVYMANQFDGGTFNFYNDYIQFNRTLVSPIADKALEYYNYKLLGKEISDQGSMIYKISINPISKYDPLFSGVIYIEDKNYMITGMDVNINKNSISMAFLDSIHIHQLYLPTDDIYTLFAQKLSFRSNILGFTVSGNFHHVFSRYVFDADVSTKVNTKETFLVTQDAKTSGNKMEWETLRPIPLTLEEKLDYIRKDSLKKIWTSKSYQDSIDRKNNAFKISDLLLGYQWSNSYKNRHAGIRDPSAIIRFNALEGTKINLNTYWTQSDSTFRKFTIQNTLQYGLADKRIKSAFSLEYLSDNYYQTFWKVEFGRKVLQFDPRQPISERSNTWNSLLDKVNKIKLFEKDFISASFKSEISNGLYLSTTLEWMHRRPMTIHSQYSWRFQQREYEDNIPLGVENESQLKENSYIMAQIGFVWSPAQTYATLPNLKVRDQSNWPNVHISATIGLPLDNHSSTFIKNQFKLRDTYVNFRLLGYFSYNIEATTFFHASPSFFGDFIHQIGNEVTMPINPDLSAFNLLPYYQYSSNKWSVQYNFRHHFNGYVAKYLPLLRKTKLAFVFGSSALYTPNNGGYMEGFIGLENFKIGPLELFSVDYTIGKGHNLDLKHGFTIRLSALFE